LKTDLLKIQVIDNIKVTFDIALLVRTTALLVQVLLWW